MSFARIRPYYTAKKIVARNPLVFGMSVQLRVPKNGEA
jgi:hypothetical protein